MPHHYYDPNDVLSPKDCIEIVRIIHTQREFSVAHILWDGIPRIGVRWNIAEREWNDPQKESGAVKSVGMPSSRGYPVWFVLPNQLLDPNSPIWRDIQNAVNDFPNPTSPS